MIREHLPVLLVVVPLMSAPLCVLLRRAEWAAAFATAVCWGAFAVALSLCAQIYGGGGGEALHYYIGGWEPPWGIEYVVDQLNAFVLLIVAGVAAVVVPFAPRSIVGEVPRERQNLFYAAFLLCMTGLLGMAVTGDAFNIFVFLEISSLSSYALIALGRKRQALMASYRYLVMGTIGGTFYLIGVGLLYVVTGTLNIADLAARLPEVGMTRTVVAAFAFLSVGVSLKLALFPLHLWLPDAYTFAPSVVTAFLASTATKVSFYVLLRALFTIFGPTLAFESMNLDAMLLPLALAGIFVGSTVAIFQRDIKRSMAWSSVAQIGYMVLGVSFVSVAGLTGGVVHLFNHALMKGCVFLAIGCVAWRMGSSEIDAFRGIARRMPWTTGAFIVGGLGLIGVPLTGGFVTKWFLVRGALEAGLWPVAVAMLLSSLLAVVYVWRVVEVAIFSEPVEGGPEPKEAPVALLAPTLALAAASIWFGVFSEAPVAMAGQAARLLLGVSGGGP